MRSDIKYLEHASIDKDKWDRQLAAAPNRMIYARSDYLDHMSPGWHALIYRDYEIIFPLPRKKKFGLQYIFYPFITAQLGAFGKGIDAVMIKTFFDAIPLDYRLIDLPLNEGNYFSALPVGFHARKNYVLPLNSSYDVLYDGYGKNTKRNLKKAAANGLEYKTPVPVGELISLAKNHTKDEERLKKARALFQHLDAKNELTIAGVYDASDRLLASAAFITWMDRAYYILVGNAPEGRQQGASHLLIDGFIRAHDSTHLLLDFEGSDIAGLAQFYHSFGGREVLYPAIKVNRLPLLIRWIR